MGETIIIKVIDAAVVIAAHDVELTDADGGAVNNEADEVGELLVMTETSTTTSSPTHIDSNNPTIILPPHNSRRYGTDENEIDHTTTTYEHE